MRVRSTRHSFNDIADTDGVFLSLGQFSYVRLKPEENAVEIGAGATYTMVIEFMKKYNVALHNVPSLPHISFIGSLVTGTHGGGTAHQ